MSEKRPALPVGSVENLPKRTKVAQLSIWKGVAMSELPRYGEAVSKSIQYYTPEQLESMPGVPNYIDFVGLEPLKHALHLNVELVHSTPQHFNVNPEALLDSSSAGGHTPIQHTLFFYGSEGSGKRRLLYSFCASRRISLLEVNPVAFDPATELRPLYEKAYTAVPVIILLNRCDAQFHAKSPTAANAGQLWQLLNQVVQDRWPIWTIFSSTWRPDILQPILQQHFELSFWSGRLNSAQCEQHWRRLLQQYCASTAPLTETDIGSLVKASLNLNARDIEQLVQKVCRQHIQHYARSLQLYARTDVLLTPAQKAFNDAVTQMDSQMFYAKNISHYTGEQI
jgi:hypothetical protein